VESLKDVLTKHADKASVLMTHQSPSYKQAGEQFGGHKKVDHSRDEYAYRERRTGLVVTTNSAESYFSLLKRGFWHLP
jgi:hypothetical protein